MAIPGCSASASPTAPSQRHEDAEAQAFVLALGQGVFGCEFDWRMTRLQKLKPALAQAGTREIGGQLFGEQLAPSDFRVTELTVQARRGSFARFMVDLLQAAPRRRALLRPDEHQLHALQLHRRVAQPSEFRGTSRAHGRRDHARACDRPGLQGSFAILMIVRLDGDDRLDGCMAFRPAGYGAGNRLEAGRGRLRSNRRRLSDAKITWRRHRAGWVRLSAVGWAGPAAGMAGQSCIRGADLRRAGGP